MEIAINKPRMNHEVLNPRNHQDDVLTAFTRLTRQFGYIYGGGNRTVSPSANTDELCQEWREKDKARIFLSRAVSDKFLDDLHWPPLHKKFQISLALCE